MNEEPIILKFGGTSVASRDSILTIVEIVKQQLETRPILVVSAVSGITESLLSLKTATSEEQDLIINSIRNTHLKLVEDLFSEFITRARVMEYIEAQLKAIRSVVSKKGLTNADLDELVSFGEIISSFIISQVLEAGGISSEQVVATRLIVTDNNFQQADFLPIETQKEVKKVLGRLISRKIVPVITGFIGSTKDGHITTLGRGGSDYSASIIGYCMEAKEVQIWTDVDGIYTADPKVVPSSRLISQISYKEASEMANFGAKVLHPKTIKPVIQKNIPVRVLNTFNPSGLGTLITAGSESTMGLKAISFKRRVTLVNIHSVEMLLARGFLAKVFEIFASKNMSVDLVSVSEVNVSVTLDNVDHLDDAVAQLERFAKVSINSNFGIVSLVGEQVASTAHIIREISDLFDEYDISIKMISLGASDTNISLVLEALQIDEAVRVIHDQILLKRVPKSSPVRIQPSFAHSLRR